MPFIFAAIACYPNFGSFSALLSLSPLKSISLIKPFNRSEAKCFSYYVNICIIRETTAEINIFGCNACLISDRFVWLMNAEIISRLSMPIMKVKVTSHEWRNENHSERFLRHSQCISNVNRLTNTCNKSPINLTFRLQSDPNRIPAVGRHHVVGGDGHLVPGLHHDHVRDGGFHPAQRHAHRQGLDARALLRHNDRNVPLPQHHFPPDSQADQDHLLHHPSTTRNQFRDDVRRLSHQNQPNRANPRGI